MAKQKSKNEKVNKTVDSDTVATDITAVETAAIETDSKQAAKAAFLPALRELVRTYQAFSRYSDSHIRELGLTSSQFDVISTLGNTDGMDMKTLAAATLVTKGTLTGIVDRLEKKALVRREVPPFNRRSFTVVLTEEGDALFQQIFPAHIAYLQQRFEQLELSDLEQLRHLLEKLRNQF
ncbi:MAG: MarR family winged helix-turn-helix transcriptional regulator [Phormidesmis sp.]